VEEREYTVTWTIQVTADGVEAAAQAALHIMQDSESLATVFEVEDFPSTGAKPVKVDVSWGKHA
jgi:hypothetical protein